MSIFKTLTLALSALLVVPACFAERLLERLDKIELPPGFDEDGKVAGQEVFASGRLRGEDDWGRPNDVLQMPDGSLLVADDKADAIYRISYKGR